MPRTRAPKNGVRHREHSAVLERHAQRFRELQRGIQQVEYFCKGTVLKRMMKCGKAQCACASDPKTLLNRLEKLSQTILQHQATLAQSKHRN